MKMLATIKLIQMTMTSVVSPSPASGCGTGTRADDEKVKRMGIMTMLSHDRFCFYIAPGGKSRYACVHLRVWLCYWRGKGERGDRGGEREEESRKRERWVRERNGRGI